MSKSKPRRTVPVAKVPTAYLYREVKPDWGKLFTKLSDIDLAKPGKSLAALPQALAALFTLKHRSAEEEAFLLVKRALAAAVADVVGGAFESDATREPVARVPQQLGTQLDAALDRESVELSGDFFQHPGRAKVVGIVARHLASWLRAAGLDAPSADQMVLHLPAAFVSQLTAEARHHPGRYAALAGEHPLKFTAAAEEENAWLRYHTELQARANPPVLDLGVSLDQVYVELRAHAAPSGSGGSGGGPPNRQKPDVVGRLTEMAEEWIADPSDPLFVLCGGPGAGKSAFARRFAAWRAWAGPDPWRVVVVPLHRFQLGTDMAAAVTDFARRELRHDVTLFHPKDEGRLLIVFDGLDELAKRGQVGLEAATDFYQQVDALVKECNRDTTPPRLKVMLCGRPVAVSDTKAEVRAAGRVRSVLGYNALEQDGRGWAGQTSLLGIDQRDEWWAKYGQAIGDETLTGLPADLRTPKLDPLTSEPILNGLIAQCRKSHKITPDTNRAQVYEWLLEGVLKRVHDRAGKVHLKNAKEEDIARLLEEVAVTAWHNGDVRATTKTKVEERCRKTEQAGLLNAVFPDQDQSSVNSLFLAFYFQEAGERQGQDRAFEFSHKSFGEYLLARRIVMFLDEVHRRLNDGAWQTDDALKRWAELFGQSDLDRDLHEFIKDVADTYELQVVNNWRRSIVRLIAKSIVSGLPMQLLGGTFADMQHANRYAVCGLYAMHDVCFRPGQLPIIPSSEPCPPLWPFSVDLVASHHSALNWTIIRHFPGLWLRGVHCVFAELCSAKFMMADLSGSRFSGSRLVGADFTGAKLDQVTFGPVGIGDRRSPNNSYWLHTDLRGSQLVRASLVGAMLEGALLDNADITDADFSQAKVTWEQLRKTVGEPAKMPDGKLPKTGWRGRKPKTKWSPTGRPQKPG